MAGPLCVHWESILLYFNACPTLILQIFTNIIFVLGEYQPLYVQTVLVNCDLTFGLKS